MTVSLEFPESYSQEVEFGKKTVTHQFFDTLNPGDETSVVSGPIKRTVRIIDKTWIPKEDLSQEVLEEIKQTAPEEPFTGVFRFEFEYLDNVSDTFSQINVSPVNRTDESGSFGPETRQDWNNVNNDRPRYPVRFPAGWDNQETWRPDEGWPPSAFYQDFFYFMESPKYGKLSNVICRHLMHLAQGDVGYFGQGNFGDLSRQLIHPVSPTDSITKNYVRFWEQQPWWRVDRYQDLTEDESRNDLQYEMYEFNRDLEETPDLYQKWVEEREVSEDLPVPSLPSGPAVQKYYRKKLKAFWPSPLILATQDLLPSKKAWTAKELVDQTIRRNKVLSESCSTKFIRSDLEKLVWTYKVNSQNGEPAGYLCRIKILPKYKGVSQSSDDILGKDFADLHIAVKCTCPAFRFWGPSFNSWSKDYHYGPREDNGQSPRKNLKHKLPLDGTTRRALLCKHLIAALDQDWMERVLTEV